MVKVGMIIKMIGQRLMKFIAEVCWDEMIVDAVTKNAGKNINDDNGKTISNYKQEDIIRAYKVRTRC